MTNDLVRRMAWPGSAAAEKEEIVSREWIVTNGLGGYASGTVSGVITRRFHGMLVAALPSPYGRRMMLNDLHEQIWLADGAMLQLGGEERVNAALKVYSADFLCEFRLNFGLPVWTYKVGTLVLEKRLVIPHRQNTVYINYRLISAGDPIRIDLRPMLQFRPHEGPLGVPMPSPHIVTAIDDRYEFTAGQNLPPLRMMAYGEKGAFTFDKKTVEEVLYRIEESRGYESRGDLWSPGYFHAELKPGQDCTVVASTESWEILQAMLPQQAFQTEYERRRVLLNMAPPESNVGMGAELVLAADQFLITPVGRLQDMARARAAGDEIRTVIAGYHWFTDWGRDTMISLEGLTLSTGRTTEAGWILRTFAYYVKDGLIPNMFPEGENDGLYHTADASLWFFHAMHRYLRYTRDRRTLCKVLPRLQEIVRRHIEGTRFGIGVDPSDGLLRQGAEGYQLTWMDAKVDGWVVTPRRGKAVEINALWYNALKLLERWDREEGNDTEANELAERAEQARHSFNQRFWNEQTNCLFDVVDTEGGGNDPAIRPNQLLSFSLDNEVLDRSRWDAVLQVAQEKLLTPVGLRSLAPGHPDYKPRYDGDLRSRDAAYHQGTVWGWLIGPFIDAYLKVHPQERAQARSFLDGFAAHLSDYGVGTIAEIFDAEAPFTPRACVAQAWSVAEALRCWVKTSPEEDVTASLDRAEEIDTRVAKG